MILEVATLFVKPGTASDFESHYRKASAVISGAIGYIGHELYKCVEEADKYILLVEWDSITDHMVGFRESDSFMEWKALLNPYYDSPPSVQHYVRIKE